jgi:hypothetical protein
LKNHSSDPQIYWTILELAPLDFLDWRDALDTSTIEKSDGLRSLIRYSLEALTLVVKGYERILSYFDEIIVEKDVFLDPEVHDSLLTDDESFSRSKRYFWAITTLKEINHTIMDNIQEIENLLAVRSPMDSAAESSEGKSRIDLEKEKNRLNENRRQMRVIRDRLKMISANLSRKLGEVTELRNGVSNAPQSSKSQLMNSKLFNASSVMESRAATRLGQNVMLLTFISIAFLPFSFCMVRVGPILVFQY